MEKQYLGIMIKREPREKGRHAKEIPVLEVTEIAYREPLTKVAYDAVLTNSMNAWLLEAVEQHQKSKISDS